MSDSFGTKPMECSPPGSPAMEFSRQEYWSWLPFPSPGDLPDPGIEPEYPAWASEFFTTDSPGKPHGPRFFFLFSRRPENMLTFKRHGISCYHCSILSFQHETQPWKTHINKLCGCVQIKLCLWTVKYEFYIVFKGHNV